jgi:CheY-like chemotaxis protein
MAHTGDGPSDTRPVRDGLRLLVVDDNRDAADTLSLLLHYWGHRPTVAYDAAAALRVAVAEPPDAVLLDLGLPGRDGFGVAEELRRTDGLRDVPLLALTGYADQQYRERAAACGFDLFLVKPVDELDLQAVLARVAEVRQLAKRSAALGRENQALAARARALLAENLRHLAALRKTSAATDARPGDGRTDGAVP